MNKWIAEFELEDGDTMPGHMDLTYHGAKLDFHCKPLTEVEAEDCISRKQAQDEVYWKCQRWSLSKASNCHGQDVWNDYMISSKDAMQVLKDLPPVYPKSDTAVLEDIKAEIENEAYHEDCYGEFYDSSSMVVSLDDVFKVIDNHISGKEEHEKVGRTFRENE